LKKYNAELLEAEKKCVMDVEKARMELDLKLQQLEELENLTTNEILLLKADVKETKSKLQLMANAKSALEIEVMEYKVNVTKYEQEIEQWKKTCSDVELKSKSIEIESNQMKEKLSKVIKSYNELKLKYVEMEESYLKQNKAYEDLSDDYSHAEREGLAEARGLRVTLATMTIEVADLKSLVDIHKKESDDFKSSLVKLQLSSTSTINGLLEELKVAENTFSDYRKHSQDELNGLHMKVTELNGLVERSRDNLEESVMKSKADKSVCCLLDTYCTLIVLYYTYLKCYPSFSMLSKY
jgi:chromosome segregation ATPase